VLEVVYSNIWIPEVVWQRVPDYWTSHSNGPAAVRAETVTWYDWKRSTGGTKVLPWCHIGDQ